MDTKIVSYGAAEFKAHCLSILDQVAEGGQAVRVTKRGKKAVRLLPEAAAEAVSAYGFLKDTARYEDELLSAGEIWDAERT
jgi:prevent-host-death family protein